MPTNQNQNIPSAPDVPHLPNSPDRKYILVVSAILAVCAILVGGALTFSDKEPFRYLFQSQESYPASNLVAGSEEEACYVPVDDKVFYRRDIVVAGADRASFVDLVKDRKKDCYGKDAERVYSRESVIAGADPKTFTILSYVEDLNSGLGLGVSYAKDKDHVFIRGEILPSADPGTFQTLQGFFAKDTNNVYYYNQIIGGADPKMFTTLSSSYGKDSQRVYYAQVSGFGGYEYSPVPNADPNTFEALEGAFGKDSKHVFAISCFGEGGPYCSAILDDADPKTFVALNSAYGKDKNHVYYPDYDGAKISDADPASFTALSEMIARDHSHVFVRDTILDGADPNTVSVVNEFYIKDGYHVYFFDIVYQKFQVLQDADPATLETVGDGYVKDSKNVYLDEAIVQGADPNTFSIAPGGYYFDDTVKDSKAVYRRDKALPMPSGADIVSLRALNHYYFADKNHVYFCDTGCATVVPNPDIGTFTTLSTRYAKDKYSAYYKMNKIPEADAATFVYSEPYNDSPDKEPRGYYDAKDKNHIYLEGNIVDDWAPYRSQ